MNKTKNMIITLVVIFVSMSGLYAKRENKHSQNHKHEKKLLKEKKASSGLYPKKQNIITLEIQGLVCSFCAYATERNIAKLDFVDKSKFGGDGVYVEPKDGLAEIAILQNKPIDFTKILQAVKIAGYSLHKIYLSQEGFIKKVGGKLFFVSEYTGQKILLDEASAKNIKASRKKRLVRGFFSKKNLEKKLGIHLEK